MYGFMYVCKNKKQQAKLNTIIEGINNLHGNKTECKDMRFTSLAERIFSEERVLKFITHSFKVDKLYIDNSIQLNEDELKKICTICNYMEYIDLDEVLIKKENEDMISIENMLYIIENLDQFGYNDLKHLGFDDIQIDKLEDIFEKINNKPTIVIKDNGVELNNFKLANSKIEREK